MTKILITLCVVLAFVGSIAAQVPTLTLVKIVKAEDSRTYDATLESLFASPNEDIQIRAALAAGRIGDEKALPALIQLLEKDPSTEVRVMAAFAIGEIESIRGADALIKVLKERKAAAVVAARAVEAAGKIAGANASNDMSKALGAAILDTLRAEGRLGSARDRDVVLMALTAALRARPAGADAVVIKSLSDGDGRVRADAGNTLARLRTKSANVELRAMVAQDREPIARANAARALGAAEDKDAFDTLLAAATGDADSRVRVSAIRSLAALKDPKAVDKLLVHGRKLLALHSASKLSEPSETGELLEISTALGRLLPGTEDNRAVTFINEFRMSDSFVSPEDEIALARVAPKAYVAARLPADFGYREPRTASAYAQGMAEIATSKDESLKIEAGEKLTAYVAGMAKGVRPADQAKMLTAMPELMQALAAFKPDNLDDILRGQLANADVFIRASAAPLLADRPKSKENVDALKSAFIKATLTDKHDNDAKMAILDGLAKLDKGTGVGTFLMALNDQDYLIRKKAFEILEDKELQKQFPGVPSSIENARSKQKDRVQPYIPVFGTRLGQVLNTDADYRRAVGRKNGSVKAVFTTVKGTFSIDFMPEEAPLTVDNFVRLARVGYFNGLMVHRVVQNFVMQDGDPRGDGNGGPGWSIRCEVNMLGYDRGAVGMALSGKDTGGSQWFVTHSPQPHLDGGYTVFGHVNETDMNVVDKIMRGDKITRVVIVEKLSPQKGARGAK